jgi:hypothetical protein
MVAMTPNVNHMIASKNPEPTPDTKKSTLAFPATPILINSAYMESGAIKIGGNSPHVIAANFFDFSWNINRKTRPIIPEMIKL